MYVPPISVIPIGVLQGRQIEKCNVRKGFHFFWRQVTPFSVQVSGSDFVPVVADVTNIHPPTHPNNKLFTGHGWESFCCDRRSQLNGALTCYTGCPTRYWTRHFFNNFITNEDIATKFEVDLSHCVGSVKEKNVLLFKFRFKFFIGVRIIKEMPGSVASGTLCINETSLTFT
jgi:hypothetical protein